MYQSFAPIVTSGLAVGEEFDSFLSSPAESLLREKNVTIKPPLKLLLFSTLTTFCYDLKKNQNDIPSKHSQMGPILAESGHSAQIGPVWIRDWNFSPCGTIIGPLLVILFSTHI